MKLFVKEKTEVKETEVHILCQKRDQEVEAMVSLLSDSEERILVKNEREAMIPLRIYDIYYIDSVDKRTFVYTEREVLESDARLYEMESRLPERQFIRISKSVIVNIAKIKSMEPEEGRRIKLVLKNGERIIISRNYVKAFKEKMGF